MKRSALIKLHLALGAMFFPFLLVMPLTGGLHLIDVDGGQAKSLVFTFTEVPPEAPASQEQFFRELFKENSVDYDFEYIRASGKDFVFRPTSRVFYAAAKTDGGWEMSRVEPDLLKRLFEIHKGHGPKFMKWIEAAFALSLIFVGLSGVWLAVTVPAYRTLLFVSLGVGLVVIVFGLL